jgi:hypothetical protein
MKNSANGLAAYSTLNSDTSSDSPCVRSNGDHLVSANVELNHIIARVMLVQLVIFLYLSVNKCCEDKGSIY